MTKQIFQTEKEGQIDFFERFFITTDVDMSGNTDGVYKGTIFEFKLNIFDINKVLFQTIKYLSHRRIRGKEIPKNILLVSLNEKIAYSFDSANFLSEIENIYNGAASRNNDNFDSNIKPEKIKYDKPNGLSRIFEIINSETWTKINIDMFCVVGWAERYYREFPNATKISMFKELRNPNHFQNFIHAWNGNETDFKYIMDCLNDKMHKKELGAFYTPPEYCKKATELVRQAISQIPKENDYIILDRCAGTGNLEEFLTDKNVDDITIEELYRYLASDFASEYLKSKANVITTFYSDRDFNKITIAELEKYKTQINIHDYLFDNELSHCIINTYELKEWIVLNERIGDKVKMIIPPPIEVKNTDSLVNGGDALSENFILGKPAKGQSHTFELTEEYYDSINELNSYVRNEKTNIILLENPPYRNDTAEYRETKSRKNKTETFVLKQYKEKKENKSSRDYDLSILFIWSAKQYYLKKSNDALIVFSPVKYFKSTGLDKGLTFKKGFLFNRQYFHASQSAVSCIWWQNELADRDDFVLEAIDIRNDFELQIKEKIIKPYKKSSNKLLISIKNVTIKKVYQYTSTIWYDNNMEGNNIAYFDAKGFGIGNLTYALTNNIDTSPYKRGFYLKESGYLFKLPLFCAKLYPQKNWYERDIYFTTADGGNRYTKDNDFLKQCFIFTCLSQKNHCVSFVGSGKIFYKNELCFDANTIATTKLKEYNLTEQEKELVNNFYEILAEGKKTNNYNSTFTYGTYQIDKELNTRYKNEMEQTIYNYPELNTKIIALKAKLEKYYEEIIQPKLFEYELLK